MYVFEKSDKNIYTAVKCVWFLFSITPTCVWNCKMRNQHYSGETWTQEATLLVKLLQSVYAKLARRVIWRCKSVWWSPYYELRWLWACDKALLVYGKSLMVIVAVVSYILKKMPLLYKVCFYLGKIQPFPQGTGQWFTLRLVLKLYITRSTVTVHSSSEFSLLQHPLAENVKAGACAHFSMCSQVFYWRFLESPLEILMSPHVLLRQLSSTRPRTSIAHPHDAMLHSVFSESSLLVGFKEHKWPVLIAISQSFLFSLTIVRCFFGCRCVLFTSSNFPLYFYFFCVSWNFYCTYLSSNIFHIPASNIKVKIYTHFWRFLSGIWRWDGSCSEDTIPSVTAWWRWCCTLFMFKVNPKVKDFKKHLFYP